LINTDFLILRAPAGVAVRNIPVNAGIVEMPELHTVSIIAKAESKGTLFLQCVLRTFTDPPVERTVERAITLNGDGGNAVFKFDPPMRPEQDGARFTVETWLTWSGTSPLSLAAPPSLS